jgi:hypothetical protein
MKTLAAIVLLVSLSGCAAPLLLGVKSYDSKGDHTHIEFITGFNTGASVSGTDTLNNNLAIKP